MFIFCCLLLFPFLKMLINFLLIPCELHSMHPNPTHFPISAHPSSALDTLPPPQNTLWKLSYATGSPTVYLVGGFWLLLHYQY